MTASWGLTVAPEIYILEYKSMSVRYQLYFLCFTHREHGLREPLHLSDPEWNPHIEYFHHVRRDDKRIFSWTVPVEFSAQSLAQILRHGWQLVAEQYREFPEEAWEAVYPRFNQLFCAVAVVVVLKESLQQPHGSLKVQDLAGQNLGEMTFGDGGTLLLTAKNLKVSDSSVELRVLKPQPKFNSTTSAEVFLNQYWQLRFAEVKQDPIHAGELVYYIPLQYQETDHHPILRIYTYTGSGKQIDKDLAEFMVYGHQDQGSSALRRLFFTELTAQWQFAHIHVAARQFVQHLSRQNGGYRSREDRELNCETTTQLQLDLQLMKATEAEAQYLLSRLQRAQVTLEINAENLANSIVFVKQAGDKQQIALDWQIQNLGLEFILPGQSQPPKSLPALLQRIEQDHVKLRDDHQYVQGRLLHLAGSSRRWQVILERRQMSLTERERWNWLGQTIVLLSALGQISSSLRESTSELVWVRGLTDWLTHPVLYVGLVAIVIVPLIISSGRAFYRKLRCWNQRRCK